MFLLCLFCLCPNRELGDFLCVLLFVVLTAALSSNFLQSMEADHRSKGEGWQTQKKRRFVAGQVRMEELLAKAVTIDARKEWYCRVCSETNEHSVSVAREVQAGCFNQGWAKVFGLVFIKRVRGQSFFAREAHWAKETESLELREENKRLKREGRKSSVQFEEAVESG